MATFLCMRSSNSTFFILVQAFYKSIIRPEYFYLLIYGRASPKILAPPEK